MTVVIASDGVVHGASFGGASDLARRCSEAARVEPSDLPGCVAHAVARYGRGDVAALADVSVSQPGGVFHQAVWAALRDVPPGSPLSYAGLAALVGRSAAVRATATACARNHIALFVPCHRVIRSDGSLGGYAYGADIKQALLDHERTSSA